MVYTNYILCISFSNNCLDILKIKSILIFFLIFAKKKPIDLNKFFTNINLHCTVCVKSKLYVFLMQESTTVFSWYM